MSDVEILIEHCGKATEDDPELAEMVINRTLSMLDNKQQLSFKVMPLIGGGRAFVLFETVDFEAEDAGGGTPLMVIMTQDVSRLIEPHVDIPGFFAVTRKDGEHHA